MRKKEPRFNIVLAEAVHEGLNSIGPSISEAVIFYIQKKTAIQLDQCDLDPVVFDDCLRAIFGWGAEIVERKILECLYVKLEVQLKVKSGFVFADEVKRAQKLLDSSDLSLTEPSDKPGKVRNSARKALVVNNEAQTF